MNANDLVRLGVSEGARIKFGMDFIVKFIGQGGDNCEPGNIPRRSAAGGFCPLAL